MKRRPFINLLSFIVLSLILIVFGLVTQSEVVKWALPAIGLAILSVGLGVNSLIIASDAYKRISEIDTTLTRIEDLQTEIRNEQKEQSGSRSTIIPTLEAFSQYYLDYVAKQKSEDEEPQ